MPHDISRVLRMIGSRPWFIDPGRAEEIIAALMFRAEFGPRAEPMFPEKVEAATAERRARINGEAHPGAAGETPQGGVRVLRLHGVIAPRMSVADMSGSGRVALEDFQREFQQAADDPNLAAIVIDVDSPGGQVDLVPETAEIIRAARRADRPIIAVANTMMASAAYWVASAADEIVATPSATVGSIGVYATFKNVAGAAAKDGVEVEFISEGPRKVEGNPFEPLTAEARGALQAEVRAMYEMFTNDVAEARGVPVATVRADPEADGAHFGGGRAYGAELAVKLGMADKVETLQDAIARAAGRPKTSTAQKRRRLALS